MKRTILALLITLYSTLSFAMDSTINESEELAFGRLGMDKFTIHPGVKCNSEINKSSIESLIKEGTFVRGIKN